MMKKTLSVVLTFIMLLTSVSLSALAESTLPFELSAPNNVTAVWLKENDSPTTMSFSYTISNETAQFYKDLEDAGLQGTSEKLLSKYGCTDIWTFVQIDWAIDDVNDRVSGWHYNEYWDAGDYGQAGYDDDGNIRVSAWDVVDCGLNNSTETAQEIWILRSVPDDERWNGNPDTKTPGIKDQLKPGQYNYHDDNVYIDFTKHTAFFRARLVTVTRKDNEKDSYHYSDWSETCGYGKDIAEIEPLNNGEIAAPVITGLRMTDKTFNDNPVAAFTLSVPDSLQTQLSVASAFGGGIAIETEARVKGDTEWTLMANADFVVKPSELECPLLHLVNDERPKITEDADIELRCRYRCYQLEKDDIFSDYSETISFGTDEINAGKTSYSDGAAGEVPAEKNVCSICHFCPRPLGICIFIWLLIIIAAVVIVIIILRSKKKKNGNKR